MAWLSSKVFVAVIVVEYRCEVPLNEGDSDFTLCKQISVVFLYFHFVAKIVKSRQKKYVSCRSAVPIKIVLNVANALSCCSSGALPRRRNM